MKKYLFVFLLLYSIFINAHNSFVATTLLIEKDNGDWILQMNSSLTAFQYLVKEGSYASAEEFKEKALKAIKNEIHIICNNDVALELSQGHINLGHETSTIFKVVSMPKEISTISVTNTSFKEINRNKNTLLILKKGFKKQRFILNNENQHHVNLAVNQNSFSEVSYSEESEADSTSIIFLYVFSVIVGFLLVVLLRKMIKRI